MNFRSAWNSTTAHFNNVFSLQLRHVLAHGTFPTNISISVAKLEVKEHQAWLQCLVISQTS